MKHLTAGDADLPLHEGKLRLYSMRFCPFAHRAHLVLNIKDVPYDAVFINLVSKPEWYMLKFGADNATVPGLIVKGQFLHESGIIADFLNEEYPEPPLYPREPLAKASHKLLIEKYSKVPGAFYKTVMSAEFDEANLDALLSHLDYFEGKLTASSTKYFAGNEVGMLDLMMWPWFERFAVIPILYGQKFEIPFQGRFPSLNEWKKNMLELPAVRKHLVPPEIHAEHLKLRKAGLPAFDGLLKE